VEIAQIITAIALLITALTSAVSLAVSVRSAKIIKKVEIQTNGLVTGLLMETRKGALAEGRKNQSDEAAEAAGVAAIQTLAEQVPIKGSPGAVVTAAVSTIQKPSKKD